MLSTFPKKSFDSLDVKKYKAKIKVQKIKPTKKDEVISFISICHPVSKLNR